MTLRLCTKILLPVFTLIMVSHVAYKYYTRKKKKENINEVNEVIMFSHNTKVLNKSKFSRCMITESMERLLYNISLTQHTMDICMYVLTNSDLTNEIVKLHYKGVKIRIIVDADMAYCTKSSIRRLERLRIPVRWMKSTNIMHHKFCLSDTNCSNKQVVPFLITGSLNWTNQALHGNWENVLVTSQKELVEQFRVEFERLWELFKPIVF